MKEQTTLKLFEATNNAVNRIDDLFEYRYRTMTVEELKQEVDSILKDMANKMSKLS